MNKSIHNSCTRYFILISVIAFVLIPRSFLCAEELVGNNIFLALAKGEMDIARAILENGYDVNKVGHKGSSLLIKSVYSYPIESTKLLLKHGANPNYANTSNGRTPLIAASLGRGDRIPHVEALLEAGANPNLYDNSGKGPLFISVMNNNTRMVQVLLGNNADPNAVFKRAGKGRPLYILEYARLKNNKKIVELLLKHGAKPGIDKVFIDSIKGDNEEVVKHLLTLGANLNITNRFGETPLHIALRPRRPNYKIVKLLLDAGANVESSADSGRTPLDYARNSDIKELLLKYNR